MGPEDLATFLPPFGVASGVRFGTKAGSGLLERFVLWLGTKVDDIAVGLGLKSEREITRNLLARYSYKISEHALDEIAKHGLSRGAVLKSLQEGASYIDTNTGRIVRIKDGIAVIVAKSDAGEKIVTTYPLSEIPSKWKPLMVAKGERIP